jgi:hypothetical protein
MEDDPVRTARNIVFSLLLVLGTACGFTGGASQSAATPRPASTSAETSPDTSGIQVTDVKLAKDFTYGDVVNPTNSFYPTDRAFHLVVDLSNPPEGTQVGAVWYAVDAGSFKNDKLDSETYTLKTGEERVHVSLTNKENWPKGKYKVQVMLNGKLNRSLEFQVK